MKVDTLLASLLILVGLACLAMSGTFFVGINIQAYLVTFIQLCLWMGIPLVIVGIVFLFIRRGKGDK